MTATDATHFETRACETCGRDFPGLVIEILGKRIYARHCRLCVAEHDLKRTPKSPEIDRVEAGWVQLCPREYRLTTELAGGTDFARLKRECPDCSGVMLWRYNPRGLILGGKTGTGKTRSAWRLLRRSYDEGRKFIAMTAGEFGRAYADAGGNHTLLEWFGSLASVDLLFLDEIGNAAWTDGAEATFFDLLEKRGIEGRPIITTSNHDSASLAKKLKDEVRAAPMIRRLQTYCDFVNMNKI